MNKLWKFFDIILNAKYIKTDSKQIISNQQIIHFQKNLRKYIYNAKLFHALSIGWDMIIKKSENTEKKNYTLYLQVKF